jgi:hypothetical protein
MAAFAQFAVAWPISSSDLVLLNCQRQLAQITTHIWFDKAITEYSAISHLHGERTIYISNQNPPTLLLVLRVLREQDASSDFGS